MLMNVHQHGIDMDQHNISNQGTLIVVKMWPNWGTNQKTKGHIFTVSVFFRTSLQLIIGHKLQPRSLGRRRMQWSEEQRRSVS